MRTASRNGLRATPQSMPMAERLRVASRVDPDTGCWIWTGSRVPFGHGRAKIGLHKSVYAHRLSYETFVGPIPDGMFVCHRCDVPSCVNPEHLWLGTNADNLADMARKGRARKGPSAPQARFSDDEIREMRRLVAAGCTERGVAERFDCAPSYVNRVACGAYRREAGGPIAVPGVGAPRGERNGSAVLTAETVVAIREAVAGGASQRETARRFGTSPAQVWRIVRGLTWASVGGPLVYEATP